MESFSGKLLYTKNHGSKRPCLSNFSKDLFPDGGPKAESLVEITGSIDCCGKTQLLLEIIAKTILPTTSGGKCGSVILYNTDHQFNKCFFERILRKFTSDEVIIGECWQRLQIVNIFIPEELSYQLKALDESVLINRQNVALIALDSLGALFYLEDDETMYHHYKKMIEQLKSITRHHQIIIAYTLPSFYQPKKDGSLTMSNYRFHITPMDIAPDSERKVNIHMTSCGVIYKLEASFSKEGLVIVKCK
ncbi:XRCC2 family protein [Megaselia abdita]